MAWRPIILHSTGFTLLISGVSLLGGCAAQPRQRPVQLSFLQVGNITRATVDERLGPPNATFDQDRVVTYRLNQTSQDYFVVPQANPKAHIDWQGITYDLVLAFDEAGTLSEYRLVAIHEPAARR